MPIATSTVLKYPGSKQRISRWIISFMPQTDGYLEPYFGSGRVFFNKQRSLLETINDIDGDVINLFEVIRNHSEELAQAIRLTPWAREEYELSKRSDEKNNDFGNNKIERARLFLVRSWMAIGFSSDVTGWRNNVKGRNGNIENWPVSLADNIMKSAKRLLSDGKNVVQIENRPAIEVIKRHNYPHWTIYADPPYLCKRSRIYRHEMMDPEQHKELLECLKWHSGPSLISGYDSELYNQELGGAGWQRKTIEATADAGKKREECLWINPVAIELLSKQSGSRQLELII